MTPDLNSIPEVSIFTDGACSGNPGPGGWAAILVSGPHRKELSRGYRRTTNNRMELLAVIESLRSLKTRSRVTVWSDSKYVVEAIEKGWAKGWRRNGWRKGDKKPALNPDLWEQLLNLLDQLPIAAEPDGTEPYLRSQFVLRAYSKEERIVDAEMVSPESAESTLARFFSSPETAFVHARFPVYGCFACRIERA